MKSTIPAPAAALLDFIAKPESNGNYLAYWGRANNKEPLPETLDDVLDWQRAYVKGGKPSSAIGRYQFMPPTLKSLMLNYKISGREKFTPDLQDELAYYLLIRRGYEQWKNGMISDGLFADNLSKEWASLPYQTGRSYYDKDGLNHSLVTRNALMAEIVSARNAVTPPAPAAKEGKPMTTVTTQDKAKVNILAGIENTIGGFISSISSAISVVASPNNNVTTSTGGGIFSSISDAQLAIRELEELIGDIQKGTWQDVPEDVIELLKTVFAILARFGINVPVVSQIVAALPDLAPVEKPSS